MHFLMVFMIDVCVLSYDVLLASLTNLLLLSFLMKVRLLSWVQSFLPTFLFYLWAFSIAAGTGNEADAAGNGIPASSILVWYRSILVPD
jgi:hypothetical protein